MGSFKNNNDEVGVICPLAWFLGFGLLFLLLGNNVILVFMMSVLKMNWVHINFNGIRLTALAFLMFLSISSAQAETVTVNPGESIQAAIDNAIDGDRIEVNPGTYNEDLDLLGKNLQIVGTGADVIINGTGEGPVIIMDKGENYETLLERLVIQGGSTQQSGGGILIINSCPVLRYLTVKDNEAFIRGSGIYFRGDGLESCVEGDVLHVPELLNSIIANNTNVNLSISEAHAIDINNSSPRIFNTDVVGNDGNGIFIAGSSDPQLIDNIIAFNGSTQPRRVGRGICFVGVSQDSEPIVQNNIIRRNRRGAFHFEGRDFNGVRRGQRVIARQRPSWELTGNRGANPRFVDRDELNLRLKNRSAARNAGSDGTDIGITGGTDPHPDYL